MSNAERAFVYSAQPSRVVFGSGSLGRLADEVKAIGAKKLSFFARRSSESRHR